MDRKTILAIVIITLILIAYPYYIKMISPPPEPPLQKELTELSRQSREKETVGDTTREQVTQERQAAETPESEIKADVSEKEEETRLGVVEDTSEIVLHYENDRVAVKN